MKTVAQAIEDFLIASEADGLADTTLAWYRAMLKQLTAFLPDNNLEDVTTDDLRRFIIKMRANYSPDTAHGHIRVQHRFWRWCGLEYGLTNPMRNIKYPKLPVQTSPRRVESDDLSKLFQVFDDSYIGKRDKAIFVFLADTGCRVTGLCNLLMSDVDIQRRRAVIEEKGRKRRVVVFTDFTAEILVDWIQIRAKVPTVFYNIETLNPLTRSGVEQLMKRLRKRAGVKGRTNPHAFRHAFAVEYLKAGGDLATLSKLMGHADVATTVRKYGLFTQDDLAEKHDRFSQVKHLRES